MFPFISHLDLGLFVTTVKADEYKFLHSGLPCLCMGGCSLWPGLRERGVRL